MINNSTLKVGSKPLVHWFGKKFHKWGSKLISRSKPKIVTNPTWKLINPFTLIINFTVDNTEKYQLVLQGDYKKHYKESSDYIPDIPEKEIFIIINARRSSWFKKE